MDNFNLKFPNGLTYTCQMKDDSFSCTHSSKQNFSSTEIITSDYKNKLEKVVRFANDTEQSLYCPYRKAREQGMIGLGRSRGMGMKSMHGMDMPCKYNQANCPYRRGINVNKSGGRWDATGNFNNTK